MLCITWWKSIPLFLPELLHHGYVPATFQLLLFVSSWGRFLLNFNATFIHYLVVWRLVHNKIWRDKFAYRLNFFWESYIRCSLKMNLLFLIGKEILAASWRWIANMHFIFVSVIPAATWRWLSTFPFFMSWNLSFFVVLPACQFTGCLWNFIWIFILVNFSESLEFLSSSAKQ